MSNSSANYKRCNVCHETKLRDEFYRNRSNADGLQRACKPCMRSITAKHYAENKAARNSRKLEYYAEDAEALNAKNSQRRKLKPEADWKHEYVRRCRRYGITPILDDFTKADVRDRWGGLCVYCGEPGFEHLEHANPVKAGGSHTLANVRPSCGACNSRKVNSFDLFAIAGKDTLRSMATGQLVMR